MNTFKPELRLELKTTQTLVMTPQLQQAIKLLQLTNNELSELLEQEMQQNPFLERSDGGASAPLDSTGEASTQDTSAQDASLQLHSTVMTGKGSTLASSRRQQSFGSDDGLLELPDHRPITLQAHLHAQVQVDILDLADQRIAEVLIDQIDDAGYLPADLTDVQQKLGISEERLKGVITQLQQFDPPGVFARNLQECLRLQLIDQQRLTPQVDAVLNHLALLGKHDVAGIVKATRLSMDEIQQAIAVIKSLNPKPAEPFTTAPASVIVPDIIMRAERGGGWTIMLNPATLPRVLVNQTYMTHVQSHARADEQKYITEKLSAANWLVRALNQRATTIINVATEVVRRQEAFFTYGIEYMKPLTLKDIAATLDVHESTVSRAASNKYMLTPKGVFPLKYFFSNALESDDGQSSVASEAIREKIRQMIAAESPDQVLSDEDLVTALRAQGIEIARRTVAKYRESLNIATSHQRKRINKNKLNQ